MVGRGPLRKEDGRSDARRSGLSVDSIAAGALVPMARWLRPRICSPGSTERPDLAVAIDQDQGAAVNHRPASRELQAFSGFAVDDLYKAQQFYGDTLGLDVELLDEQNGLLTLHLAGDRDTLAVDELASRGVSFEQYDNDAMAQDEKGVMREGGPLIAWFKDPAGNTLSVLQER